MSAETIELIKRRIQIHEYADYYCHEFGCSNCGTWQYCYVRKGRRLDGLDINCDKCGCTNKLKSAQHD